MDSHVMLLTYDRFTGHALRHNLSLNTGRHYVMLKILSTRLSWLPCRYGLGLYPAMHAAQPMQ